MLDYPRWIVFQLLEHCNLRCKMCYEWGDNGSYFDKDNLNMLSFDVIEKMIEESKPYRPYFELFGGEPLLYPQFTEVIKAIHDTGASFDIPTNGTMVERYVDELIAYAPNRLWISIDGPQEYNDAQRGKGVYQKAVNGMKALYVLKKNKKDIPAVGVTMVVTPDNYRTIRQLFMEEINPAYVNWFSIEFQLYITKERYDTYNQMLQKNFKIEDSQYAKGLIRDENIFQTIEIPELIQQLHDVKIYCDQKNIQLIGYPKVHETKNLHSFYQGKWDQMTERKKHCSLSYVYAEVSASGHVTPCHTFYDYSIGNVYEQSLKEIWIGDKVKHFRKIIKKEMFPICIACSRYYSEI